VVSGLKIIPVLLIFAATAAYPAAAGNPATLGNPASAGNPADTKDAAKGGAVLYRDKGCGFCHGPALQGTKKAPALANIRSDKTWPPKKITDQILNGGKKMPPFRDALSDEEIQQLVIYLRAKDRPTPPPTDTAATPPAH
jgi:mono/diheme cytochrome c family protein